MASIKHIDSNPEFVFEYTNDVEHVVKDMLTEHFLPELLDASTEILSDNKKRLTVTVYDCNKANMLSEALKMFRVNFYGLKEINNN